MIEGPGQDCRLPRSELPGQDSGGRLYQLYFMQPGCGLQVPDRKIVSTAAADLFGDSARHTDAWAFYLKKVDMTGVREKDER